ncbi:MAG: sigma factor [Saprospiraceae bacterium]
MELTLTKHTNGLSSQADTTTHNLSPKATEDYILVQAAIEGDQRAFFRLCWIAIVPPFITTLKMVRNPTMPKTHPKRSVKPSTNYPPTHRFAFSTWLFKIAVNNCIDHIRKKRLHFLSIDQPF